MLVVLAFVCLTGGVWAQGTSGNGDDILQPVDGFTERTPLESHSDPSRRQPHIVFVLADDLGYYDVGYHGTDLETPTMDSLAQDGVILENYYVQPTCSPSRSSFLTGRYLIHMGIQHGLFWFNQPSGLPLDNTLISDKLKEVGYATHIVGKWHAGYFKEDYMPHNRGFDTFFGFLNGNKNHVTHNKRFNGQAYLDLRFNDDPLYNLRGQYSSHIFTRRAQEIIDNHDPSEPLFLYVPHQVPHSPMQVPPEYEARFSNIRDRNRRIFAGMLYTLDESIANITRSLRERGMWDDTLFIFSSDNGGDVNLGGFNYPLKGFKFSLWEGGIRVPAFVSGGRNIQLARNTVSDGLMHISDWYPTLINVAGGNLNGLPPLDGVDNWDMLSTGAPSARNMLLHNIDPLFAPRGSRDSQYSFDNRMRAAIRVGDYKLITGDPGQGFWYAPPEREDLPRVRRQTWPRSKNIWLYNIAEDPTEDRDLSGERPDIVIDLMNELAELNANALPAFFPPRSNRVNPALHGGVWGPWW